jgi:hypothetical protein
VFAVLGEARRAVRLRLTSNPETVVLIVGVVADLFVHVSRVSAESKVSCSDLTMGLLEL